MVGSNYTLVSTEMTSSRMPSAVKKDPLDKPDVAAARPDMKRTDSE